MTADYTNGSMGPTSLRHLTSNPTLKPVPQASSSSHAASNPSLFHPRAPGMKERQSSTGSGKPHVSVSPPTQQYRLGSRSPASIPSSPTSVHSSSSAIFERDIEPPAHPFAQGPSHPHPTNPHRMPRAKATEPIDQSVPNVLDSAAELLTSQDDHLDEAQIAVEAPAPISARLFGPSGSAIGSPIGKGSRSPIGVGSRSPSPSASSAGKKSPAAILLNLPSSIPSLTIPSPPNTASPSHVASERKSPTITSSSPPRPLLLNHESEDIHIPGSFSPAQIVRSATPSSMITTETHYESAASSPTTTTMEHPPHGWPSASEQVNTPTSANGARSSPGPTRSSTLDSSAQTILTHSQSQMSHPPSPSHVAQKRLSFVAYNDLLASVPTSTLPLSSLTCPGTSEPPPHLPTVSLSLPGAINTYASSSPSQSASTANSIFNVDGVVGAFAMAAADVKEPSGSVTDDVGGEWEREGLGKGLEERLETLLAVGPSKA